MDERTTPLINGRKTVKIDFAFCFKFYMGLFVGIFFYTFARYNIYKGVAFHHIPIFILNKNIAVTGTICLCLSYAIGPLARVWPKTFGKLIKRRAAFGVMGFVSMLIHVCWSVMTFTPAMHPQFFDKAGEILGRIEGSILFATIATVHLGLLAIISITVIAQSMDVKQWRTIQRSGMWALGLTLGHLGLMGAPNWFSLEKWAAPLPPTTLVSAAVIVTLFLLRKGLFFYSKILRPLWLAKGPAEEDDSLMLSPVPR